MSLELIEELRATFDYHEDGFLIRKSTGRPCGRRANQSDGYTRVWVNGRLLYAHRIIYAIVHGEMPEGQIDHINGIRSDNRIENLRDVCQSKNQHNRKMNKGASSGFQGVCWYARYQKWRAHIWVDNKYINLGYFEEFEDAVEARKKAKIKYHPTSPEAIKYANECVEFN